jgi:putative Holliday junction resolvase
MQETYKRTYLGFDYGEKRIGLAKSDPTGLIASALTTIEAKSPKAALEQIAQIIRDTEPDGLVVGYPLWESGEKSPKCEEVDRFIGKLEKLYDGPIHKTDERYSSVEAVGIIHAHGKKAGKDKKRIDRLAAVIILQRFLDEHPAE